MKIGLFSPYLPSVMGGGEKYLFDVAGVFQEEHQVVVGVSALYLERWAIARGFHTYSQRKQLQLVQKQYEQFLGRSLAQVQFEVCPLFSSGSIFSKMQWTAQFGLLFYITDGSFFFSLAKQNILHIQVPLKRAPLSRIERLKLLNWQVVTTNSEFTKTVVESEWKLPVDMVHYPAIEVPLQAPKVSLKEPIILNVGRFFTNLHSKRQDVLITTFRELKHLYPKQTKLWKLVLIGTAEDEEYARQVAKQAQGLPVEILHNVSRKQLVEWYKKASIYWHAAGYDVSQLLHPEKVEHFGISTAEAMSYGCVPVVHKKGGLIEVLGKSLQFGLWTTIDECVAKTKELLLNPKGLISLQKISYDESQKFSYEQFARTAKSWLREKV